MSRKALVPIELPADPATAMEAVTKQYADKMNEVYISTTQPADPNDYELWYDPDAT